MSDLVYILHDGDLFKIGRSTVAALPSRIKKVAPTTDLDRSYILVFDEVGRTASGQAAKCERALQIAFRQRQTRREGDGGTEWFTIDCFDAVAAYIVTNQVNLGYAQIIGCPVLFQREGYQLPSDGDEIEIDLSYITVPRRDFSSRLVAEIGTLAYFILQAG